MDMGENVTLIEELLKLNKVKASDRIALVTSHDYKEDEIEAYRIALGRLETEFVHVVLPPRASGPRLVDRGTQLFFDMMEKVDFIIGPSSSCHSPIPGIHTPRIGKVLKEKQVRYLTVQLPLETVRQMWTTDDLVQRTRAGAELLENAETIRIVSGQNRELLMSKKGRPAHCQLGIADTPGRWDNAAFGCVSCAPLEHSANGKLYIEPPAAISPLVRFVQEPVELTLENGYITRINGGLEAKLLDRWFARWGDQEAYGTSHIGWGTHKGVGLGEAGGRANLVSFLHNAYGTILIAFGSNDMRATAKYSGYDGERETAAHCDIGGWNVDFYLDDRLICSNGEIVAAECR